MIVKINYEEKRSNYKINYEEKRSNYKINFHQNEYKNIIYNFYIYF